MPAHRARLAFEPMAPDLDIDYVVETTENFQFADRVTCDSLDRFSLEQFEKLAHFQVVLTGRPLVVEGFQERLDQALFSEKWLRETYSSKVEDVRDLRQKNSKPFTIGHYLKSLPILSRKINRDNYMDKHCQRLYMKDIDCPSEWRDHLEQLVPPSLFYLNDSPKPFSGPASSDANMQSHPKSSEGEPLAPAGDLMSSLPPDMRAENLMCYIGHEGTYTPAHQEMCASLGHNIMVDASDGTPENGQNTEPGSSIWFMTERKDRHVVSEYWMSVLGHDIDIEDFFAPLHAWVIAPFKTWVVHQKPGDLILVPPLAAHQVWNRGTRTIKVAWNRTTIDTLELALGEALPHARMVCRDEQYKNKAIVFFTLERYAKLLRQASKVEHPVVDQLWDAFKRLFKMYMSILLSETFSRKSPEKEVEYHAFQSNVTCSYCRCNIFNRFLTCPSCAYSLGGDDDPYDVCMDCYVMGRSCGCISNLKWVEQFHWKELTERYESWRRLILSSDPGNKDLKNEFPTFVIARGKAITKTTAEICQEQLKRRPWNDPNKPNAMKNPEILNTVSGSEDDSRPRKRKKVRKPKKLGSEDVHRCHVCLHFELNWKLATCSNCDARYCYGSLFRAFEISPQSVMEKYHWLCPKCEKICSCGGCKRDSTMRPYEPNCTVLGHDTSKVADFRSVESLVDFRKSNLWWLKKFGDDVHGRIKKHQDEAVSADLERQKTLEEHGFLFETSPSDQQTQTSIGGLTAESNTDDAEEIPVDPSLMLESFVSID
ncbi:uncharacterized protein N7511_006562 [Penicillium nucicola]|uniref:uncharacterized protein n=1 Tax=Penicillium nucicola TaxID=1850975 RepID=UPI00254571C0|nr:uncharacterized protein N7511_006562 [Penicillium nucicola]KAJ5757868.1 hypothetical protein N7511_006562 [Penicillium nucicola]